MASMTWAECRIWAPFNTRRTSPSFMLRGSLVSSRCSSPPAPGHKWNLDAFRHTREVLPPTDYLESSYYEQWFSGLLDLLVRRGLVTAEEIQSGKPATGTARATPPLTPEKIPPALPNRIHAQRDVQGPSLFKVGRQVRARNIN